MAVIWINDIGSGRSGGKSFPDGDRRSASVSGLPEAKVRAEAAANPSRYDFNKDIDWAERERLADEYFEMSRP